MILPLGNRLLVEPIKEDASHKTASGLVISDAEFKAPQSIKAKVIAVGDNVVTVEVGDIVLCSQFAPTQAKEKPGDNTVIVPEEDLLAVVKPDKLTK